MAARKPTNPVSAEVLGAPIDFTYEGEAYAVQPSSEWTLDALEAFENGKILTVLSEILAPGDYARFRARYSRMSDLSNFMTAVQEALGAGN